VSCNEGPPNVGTEAYSTLAQFYQYDRDVPLDARVLQRDQSGAHPREKVVFRGLCNSRVPGHLGLPASGAPPYPCVLLAHGMGASKDFWWQPGSNGASMTQELLSSGLAVLALDGPFHGERTYEIDYEPIGSYIRPNIYRELIVQWTTEHRLAIDYLASRPEVDGARIGILGHSLGGVMAYNLTGVDSRIRAAVITATAPLTRHYINVIGWDETALVRMTPIAPQTFAAAIRSSAVLVLHGRDDPYSTIEGVQALYESIASPAKELVIFEGGHRLPNDHQTKVVEWFGKYLK
jgi:dipeptidyl aminopeptidase/acylaminoacyl peptidase